MVKITLDDQKLIADAITEVENSTSGEVLVVSVEQSSNYTSAHLRLGIIFALLVVFIPGTHKVGHEILYFQAPLFLIGYLLCFIPKIKYYLIPKHEKDYKVNQRSLMAFFDNNLHATQDRTGILIFVSLMEKQVVILADTGINQKVEKGTWQKIMDDLIAKIKKKNLVHGLQTAVHSVGEILSIHFPPKEINPNEIENSPQFLKK